MTYNVNAPLGLVPTRYLNGTPWNGQANKYLIATTPYATAIGQWDPVTKLNDGTVGIGVAGATCLGSLRGIQYIDTAGEPKFASHYSASLPIKANTQIIAFVVDDKSIVFTVQETNAAQTGAGTPLALADVGLNINFVVGTPNALGQSTTSLNNETEANTATLNLTLLGLTEIPGNVVGNFANWDVTWCNHFSSGGVQGV